VNTTTPHSPSSDRLTQYSSGTRTGHVFGIFFNRCSLLAAPDIVLSQCEMEYLRSRSLLDHDEEEILREMEHIDRWLLSYLTARGQTKNHTFYSSSASSARSSRPGPI
jgi:hypothetical protein